MRIFVTHICPKDKIIEYGLSLSASYFNYNLIEGGGFDKVYSIYPGFIKGKLDPVDDDMFDAVYSSWRWKGGIRQKLSRFVEQMMLYRKIPRGAKIWYYNLSTLNVLLIILLKYLKPSVQQNIILLDYTPDLTFNRLVLPLINSMHGRISLSMFKKFSRKNFICLPGVVPKENISHPEICSIKNDFLLSGALNENITMLSMVLDAFSEMPDCTLHLSGILRDCKDKVKEYCNKYPNIIFHGKMPYDEFRKLLENTTFSLNTRNPHAPENLANFPSKVIEALLYNRIVVSTIDYPQLQGINYIKVADNKEMFKRDIQRVVNMTQEKLLCYANQQQHVYQLFNAKRWYQFMSQLENI
jgi:hypothetical protein